MRSCIEVAAVQIRFPYVVLLMVLQHASACAPNQYADCRNDEDVITMGRLVDTPLRQLRILPSGNCMAYDAIQQLNHKRDPYTNLDLPTEWQQRCLRPQAQPCARGQFWDADRCKACPKGWTTPGQGVHSSADCTMTCEAGHRMVDQAQYTCEACVRGRYGSTRGATTCTECSEGYYQEGVGGTTCKQCQPGHTNNSNHDWCDQCGSGSFNADWGNTCKQCARGRFSWEWGVTECAGTCWAGKDTAEPGATRAADCRWCPAGSSNPENGGICHSCKPGTVSSKDGSTECEECPAGSSTNGKEGHQQCSICKPGTYSSTPAAPSCSECRAATYSTETGAKSINVCQPCPAGHTTPERAANSPSLCKACRAGTFIEPGQEACRVCDKNTWSDAVGASSPSTCQPCPAGHITRHSGANSAGLCLACGVGKFIQGGQGDCEDCPAHTWSANVGASSRSTCRPCPRNRPYSRPGTGKEEDCTQFDWAWWTNVAIAMGVIVLFAGFVKFSASRSRR